MDPESIPPVDDSLSRSEEQLPKTQPKGFLGKHRMAAAISNLQSQINLLQEELDQLEELVEASSIVCREIISSVESIPDPLLPLTKGSTNISWDRWFTGAPNSCKALDLASFYNYQRSNSSNSPKHNKYSSSQSF